MKKIFKNIFLGLALTACTATPLAVGVSFLGKQTGDASVKNDGSYVLVDELWNNTTRTFNKNNVRILLRYMGLEDKILSEVTTASATPKNASDFRAVEVAGKISSQDINVMLGGLEWTVCYLSQDKSGNPTLTLWLSNSTQGAFAGRSQTEGEYYGYITDSLGAGLYSDWSYNWWSSSTSLSYPSAMYGTSYIRAVTLNNGGKYALSGGETLSAEVEQDSNSAFALFTMSANNDGKDLVGYITTPSQISWQESGQSAKETAGFAYKTPNDNWGIEDDTDYYSSSYNYSSKSGYDTWKNDKLWLPSMSETGYTGIHGLWQTNVGQRKNYDANYTASSIGAVGTYNTDAFLNTWLRSGNKNYAELTYDLYSSGVSFGGDYIHSSYAVRPALHLNLSSLLPTTRVTFDANGGNCSTTNVVLYANDTYGSLPTPTKSGYKFKGWYLDEEFTQPVTSETIVTNSENHTLYAKWEDWVEYKSYYDYFIDNMDCTGVYDTDGNLTNVTISAEKKAEILSSDFTGSGTSTDPYQINSSLGFWYMSKFVTLTNCYVELNYDVILNDEHFDENGNVLVDENGEPIYGDGIVYSWLDKGYNFGNDFCLDGHKHTIYGMYLNTESTFDFSLFGYGTVKELKNLNMANSFVKMKSGHVGMMVCGVQKISNCHNLSGRIEFTSSGYLAGITYTLSEKMENCSNYAEIYAPNCSICGGIYVFNTKNDICLDNVINYGNITAKCCGGFIPEINRDVNLVMNNCKNYGKITALGNHCGAFFALFNGYNICVNMINCANYGNVEASGNGAGICGYCIGDWNIVNFKNYGKITAAYAGSFFGVFVNSGKINIKDCYSTSQNKAYIFDSIYNKDVVEIDGLEIEFNSDEKTAICRSVSVGAEVNLQNVLIKGKCKNYSGCIISRVSSAKNVLVDIDCTSISTRTNYLCVNSDFSANGVMLKIHTATTSIKQYYGSNFRDFYLDWRTDKIGLNALDGVGIFQGRITEEWLVNNGYVKKG